MVVTAAVPSRACRVPVEESLPEGVPPDYADAFEVRVAESDGRTAERMIRDGLEGAPGPVRWTILVVHRHVLRFRLGPRSSPTHVLGWRITASSTESTRLEASSPLLRGVIVGHRRDVDSMRLTTLVVFGRPAARWVWRVVGPLHRRFAPHLLARAARAGR